MLKKNEIPCCRSGQAKPHTKYEKKIDVNASDGGHVNRILQNLTDFIFRINENIYLFLNSKNKTSKNVENVNDVKINADYSGLYESIKGNLDYTRDTSDADFESEMFLKKKLISEFLSEKGVMRLASSSRKCASSSRRSVRR